MTNLNNQAIVGDIIKSFDFAGHTEHYMIGEVVEINDSQMLICRSIKQVVSGMAVEAEKMPATFRTPQMGQCMMDSKWERVIIVG